MSVLNVLTDALEGSGVTLSENNDQTFKSDGNVARISLASETNTISVVCLVNNSQLQTLTGVKHLEDVKQALNRYRPIQPQLTSSKNESQSPVDLLKNVSAMINDENGMLEQTGSAENISGIQQLQIAGYFCNICNCFYECSTHCPAHTTPEMIILDSPISSKARLTLPKQLCIKTSKVMVGTSGIWSCTAVEQKTQFGPLTGKTVAKESVEGVDISDKTNLWKIFHLGQLTHGLETNDENECNWLMFLQRARTGSEQNLVAFLFESQVFFMTTRPILPDEELLFWFSADFCQALGLPVKPEDGFTCCECSKRFVTASRLERHKRYLHANINGRKFRCTTCDKLFSSATKLTVHTFGHMGIKPHSCSYCNKQFSDASNLRGHLSIHTGERRFSCNICSRSFRQKAHLTSHLLIHSGEKKYKCQFCDRWFARNSDLRQHETAHTCEREFPCPVCNKIFYRLQTQKKHLKVHNGQKDFECGKCSKRFFSKYHLERHEKSCRGQNSVNKAINS